MLLRYQALILGGGDIKQDTKKIKIKIKQDTTNFIESE